MTVEKIEKNGVIICSVKENEPVIIDSQSALDLMMTLLYDYSCSAIILNKEAVSEDFFKLGTGLAGEVLQKFSNYRTKLALYGDFSGYKSKPLQDFIYESNNGGSIFFVSTETEAVEKIIAVKK